MLYFALHVGHTFSSVSIVGQILKVPHSCAARDPRFACTTVSTGMVGIRSIASLKYSAKRRRNLTVCVFHSENMGLKILSWPSQQGNRFFLATLIPDVCVDRVGIQSIPGTNVTRTASVAEHRDASQDHCVL